MNSPDQIPSIPSSASPPSVAVVPVAPVRIKRRLKRVGPLSAGTTLALLYGALGLIIVPFMLLMMTIASHAPGAQAAGAFAFGIGFAIAAPFMYAAMGFLTGVIGAALYNLFARWTGGIEVEME